jgi:predicted RNA-binding Zn-ribbon protein involved in translation (DUF1610 family)
VSVLGDVTTHTARKRHQCSSCEEMIEPGETYLRWVWVCGRDVFVCKMHPECEAMHQAAAAARGDHEWEFGGQSLPCPEPGDHLIPAKVESWSEAANG